MLSAIRHLLGRLRGSISDRRRAPRYEARLFFSVSIVDEAADRENARPSQTLVGRTRNVSETGFGLIVPSLWLGAHKLNEENATLRLMLNLPDAIEPVEVQVVPVRSFQLGEGDKESGYFIGAQITHLSDEARAPFTKLLRSLSSRH